MKIATFTAMKNARNIANLRDGSRMVFASGRFDSWCIYHIRGNACHAIRDVEVFERLNRYTTSLERFDLYEDYTHLFENVTKVLNQKLIDWIIKCSCSYARPTEVEFCLVFLYAGMVAEENKDKAILKKFVKRLGVHQVLIETLAPSEAANYSKGKKWRELQLECKARGFYSPLPSLKLSA